MRNYNHYPILIISDIDNKVLKLKLTYYPTDQEKYEELHNILVRESHIAEAFDFLLEHFYLIQKYTENKITFEVSSLEILNEYRQSIAVRDIAEGILNENFDVKININFKMKENDTSDFFSILKRFINEQEEDTLHKMVEELEMMSRRKREDDLLHMLIVKDEINESEKRTKI